MAASLAGISHIGVLAGSALVARAEGGNVIALRNEPLLSGDTLTTASGALAEVQLASGALLRLDGSTRVQLVSLIPDRSEFRLLKGTIALRVDRGGDAPQVDTPSIVLRPDRTGLYRIAVTDTGQSAISVHDGTLRLITPNGTQLLDPGEQVTVDGPPASPHLRYAAPPASDAFDSFNETRDAALAAMRDDLAPYGSWVNVKGYGSVWSPREFPGWAPYHSGRWLWRRGIGWTWVSRESWGWRPYHGGAWVDDSARGWCWVPSHARTPVSWSPSNAIFFAVVVNGRTQSIGWVALAPGESYHAKLDAYRNAAARGGITLLAISRFYSADFSHPSFPSPSQLPGRILLQAPPSARQRR